MQQTVAEHANYLGQVMLGLAAVLGLIFITYWVARRIGQNGFLNATSMKIISSLSVGTRERVVLISADDQRLLLGVAPGGITTLHVFPTPVVNSTTQPEEVTFSRQLHEIIGKGASR